jgi:hypothetical protein
MVGAAHAVVVSLAIVACFLTFVSAAAVDPGVVSLTVTVCFLAFVSAVAMDLDPSAIDH